jgi:glycosyltransferase involved in cell wall biosynthesis
MAGADFGGAEAFFVRLVLALRRAGLEQKVIIRENQRRAAALRAGGIEPVQLPFGGAFDFTTGFAFRREIKEYKPQIVMTWMNRATKACPKGDFVQVGRLGGYYDLKYYKNCRHLIGNTEDIVEYLVKQGWPADRVHHLPNFVSEEKAPPLNRREFYTPDSAPLVLAMGRLHENKAFDVLLQAVARVPDIYLWLAGEGPLRADLEKQANHLGIKPRVRFLGWREDTAALLATCDLFVCPSRHEPLGNVVLEAWAQGVPVVAADSIGPGTLIGHMENGILVPVDDAVNLAKAIRHMLEDDVFRGNIGAAGRAAYEEGFTEQRVVDRYLSFFQQVLS